MLAKDIARYRLYNQLIAQETVEELPGQAVARFGALQAQDYASAKWAVGLRCYEATDAIIEGAIADRTIIRTWLLRGTLHIAAASDVRWMLALLAPRLIASSARRHQQLELDTATFAQSFEVLSGALQGGGRLTRAEMMLALEGGGISTRGPRGYHILQRAGLEGLICFGPSQEKQETFVLLDEWAPRGKHMERDEALAELAGCYFESHGPATLQDFVWWSGLPVADARTGLELAKPRFHQERIGGQLYWQPQSQSIAKDPSPTAYLLPAFDEYFLGYKGRDVILDPKYDRRVVSNNGVFRPMIVIDGQVVGIWKRTLKKGSAIITPGPFESLTEAEAQALVTAANHYGIFLGLSVLLA